VKPCEKKQISRRRFGFLIITRQKSIAFILSDFLDEKYEEALKVAAKKHDLIGVKVYDKMDMQLPEAGVLEVEDAETGAIQWVDTNDYLVRTNYQQSFFSFTEL